MEANNNSYSYGRKRSCNVFDGNKEVKAWAYDSIAQGVFFMSLAFYASAIVGLAEQKAGCADHYLEEDGNESSPCDGKVYGVRPGAILTLVTTIAGFFGSILMPLVGAVIDHTKHRRAVALSSAIITLLLAALQLLLSAETLLMCIIFMALAPMSMLVHIVTLFAYLNELTDDETKLGRYMGLFVGIRSIAMLLFMLIVIAISATVLKVGEEGLTSLERDIATARVSQGLIVLVAGMSFIPTFRNGLGKRPASSQCPPGQSLIGAGFRKLITTTKSIVKTCPAIKWYLLANILFGSIVTSVPSITISYMTDFLRMDASQTGIVMLIASFFMIIGSLSYRALSSKLCAFLGLKIVLVMLTALLILYATIIHGPQHIKTVYYLSPFWGLCFGWIIPNGRTIYVTISPKGQEAELMGIYIFFSNGFIWLPPLIITILITNGISWRFSIGILSIFVFASIIILNFMGSYKAAKLHAIELSNNNDTTIVGVDTTDATMDEKLSIEETSSSSIASKLPKEQTIIDL